MNIPEEAVRQAAIEVFDEMPACANCLRADLPCTYCTDDATRYARAALEAAWAVMRPEVTDAEQLAGLPVGTLVRCRAGRIWEPNDMEKGRWLLVGWTSSRPASAIPLPATVIYRP